MPLVSSPPTIISPVIADTGATGHFITSSAPYHNKRVAQPGISVLLPDGSTLQSTHPASLHLPQLPANACQAHIFPHLASGSLISIGQLCNHGCKAVFDATTVTITHHNEIILQGIRSPISRLWTLDLPSAPPASTNQLDSANAMAHNSNIADRVAFYHAAMFSPALSTWCDTIDAGHLTTWPALTSAQVR